MSSARALWISRQIENASLKMEHYHLSTHWTLESDSIG